MRSPQPFIGPVLAKLSGTSRKPRGPWAAKFYTVFMPWTLPREMSPTHTLKQSELIDEASAMQPLIRAAGWRDAALLNPTAMNRQYLRFVQARGRFPLAPYLWQYLGGFGAMVLFAAMFSVGVAWNNDEHRGFNVPWYFAGLFGGVFGMTMGFLIGYYMRSFVQFRAAYAFLRLIQKTAVNGHRQAVALWEGYVYRPVFAGRTAPGEQSWWRGPEEHSGYAEGMLSLDVEMDLSQLLDVCDIYNPAVAVPSLSTFNNSHSTTRFNTSALSADAGDATYEHAQERLGTPSLGGWLVENWGVTVLIFGVLVGMAAFLIGIEYNPSDPTASILGGG